MQPPENYSEEQQEAFQRRTNALCTASLRRKRATIPHGFEVFQPMNPIFTFL
jgi:hypothetical protein